MTDNSPINIPYYKPFSLDAPVLSKLPIPIIPLEKPPKSVPQGPVALLKPWFLSNGELIKPNLNFNLNLNNQIIIKAVLPLKKVPSTVSSVPASGPAPEQVLIKDKVEEDIIIIKPYYSYGNRYKITITNKGYMCNLCKNIYKDLSYIQLHQREHDSIESGIKKYKCEDCFASFTMKKHLTIHLKRHK